MKQFYPRRCYASQHTRLFGILFDAYVKNRFAFKLRSYELIHHLGFGSYHAVLHGDEVQRG